MQLGTSGAVGGTQRDACRVLCAATVRIAQRAGAIDDTVALAFRRRQPAHSAQQAGKPA